MSARTAPINTRVSRECVVRDVLFEDNATETFVLAPGWLVSDVLRERGDKREYLEFPGGLTTVNS